jgi:hypothetical protein
MKIEENSTECSENCGKFLNCETLSYELGSKTTLSSQWRICSHPPIKIQFFICLRHLWNPSKVPLFLQTQRGRWAYRHSS